MTKGNYNLAETNHLYGIWHELWEKGLYSAWNNAMAVVEVFEFMPFPNAWT